MSKRTKAVTGVAGAVAAGLVAVAAFTNGALVPKPSATPMCARSPADGGVCFRSGSIPMGAHTSTRVEKSSGRCEVFECPRDP